MNTLAPWGSTPLVPSVGIHPSIHEGIIQFTKVEKNPQA